MSKTGFYYIHFKKGTFAPPALSNERQEGRRSAECKIVYDEDIF